MKSFLAQVTELVDLMTPEALLSLEPRIGAALEILSRVADQRLPLLVCGNGGSAADSQHIAGELVGKFLRERQALNVRALSTDTSVITAWANDVAYDTVFSRQVEAYGAEGGALLAISTSGNSRNVVEAARRARRMGMAVVALTGAGGGALAEHASVLIDVPSRATPRVQEMHMMVYHFICEQVEASVCADRDQMMMQGTK
jgi:D-sedoheptulose 7-phosphate isomerase